MKELIEKMEREAEEYGQYHDAECPQMSEDADIGAVCECEIIRALKTHARESMESVNRYWIEMCEAHRKHCTPEGRKDLTRLQGKKNRSTPPKQN